MTHYSQVDPDVFGQIKRRHKIIEPRIRDNAHQRIRLGDLIMVINRHTGEEIVTKVVGVLRYGTFAELFAAFPAQYFGYDTPEEAMHEVSRWYSRSAEQTHGVLGIKLHVLAAAPGK